MLDMQHNNIDLNLTDPWHSSDSATEYEDADLKNDIFLYRQMAEVLFNSSFTSILI